MTAHAPENRPASAGAADAWFTPWRFAFILAGLIAACFPKVVLGLETFFYRDYGAFSYPVAYHLRESFWRGEIPLWNPLNHCGVPFLAQWNTLALYPPSLFYLVFPLTWALGMFCLGHIFFAGLGMYFLVFRLTGNRLAASAAGLVFAFNGLTWHAIMWPSNLAAIAWMPWVVLAVQLACQSGRVRAVLIAALAGALQMLSGAPEIILETWLFLGAWVVFEAWRGKLPFRRGLLMLVVVTGLVALLAAAQLLPFLDLLAHSQRDAGFGDSDWSMARSGLANYLVPLFHSPLSFFGTRIQYSQEWTGSYYVGVGTVAFALLAAWRVRDWRIWFLLGVTGCCLALAMGNFGLLYPALKHIVPLLGFMRYPIKFVVLPTFLLPLLAAQGLAWFAALPAERQRGERKSLLVLASFLLAVIAAIVGWALAHPVRFGDGAVTIHSALSRAGFLLLTCGCVTTMRLPASLRGQLGLRHALLLLAWFDIFTHTPNPQPTVATGVYEPDLVRQFFHWEDRLQPGQSRAMEGYQSLSRMFTNTVEFPADDLSGRRLALFSDYNLLDHIPKLDGFYSTELGHVHEVVTRLYSVSNGIPKLEDFLGVAYASNPTNPVGWVARDSFLPLVTAGQEPVFVEDSPAFRDLTSDAFDPRRVVYLPPEARPLLVAAGRSKVRVLSTNFASQRIEASVDAAAPAVVVIAQAYYHPWHAYVDGRPVPLLRANYAFQALSIPAGRHDVKLVYEDRAFQVGAFISILSLAGSLAGWFQARRREGV